MTVALRQFLPNLGGSFSMLLHYKQYAHGGKGFMFLSSGRHFFALCQEYFVASDLEHGRCELVLDII